MSMSAVHIKSTTFQLKITLHQAIESASANLYSSRTASVCIAQTSASSARPTFAGQRCWFKENLKDEVGFGYVDSSHFISIFVRNRAVLWE